MLSVIIIAKNESANIRRCLESIQWAQEIIVLDSGSTDDTVAIAKEYTPHVFCTDWQGYGVQKQRALSKTTQTWVLNLDADESVNACLKVNIIKSMTEQKVDACRVPIRMCFYGKTLRFSSSPSRHARLFKREGARFSDDIVHEKIVLPQNARIGQLTTPILHHSFQDVSHAIEKMNRYSSYSAKIRIEEKKRGTMFKTLSSTLWMFFRCYFLQAGILDGRAGLLFAALNAQGAFFRGIKQIYPDKHQTALPKVINHKSASNPHE